MVQKKYERQNRACQRGKNDKASRCCWSAYQKKIRRNATQPEVHFHTYELLPILPNMLHEGFLYICHMCTLPVLVS